MTRWIGLVLASALLACGGDDDAEASPPASDETDAEGDAGPDGGGDAAAPHEDSRAGSGTGPIDPASSPEEGFRRYVSAFNTAEQEAVTATLAHPYLTVLGPALLVTERAEDHVTNFPGDPWERSVIDSLDVINASDRFAHLDVVFSRLDGDDTVFAVGRAIYGMLATDDGWKAKFNCALGLSESAPPDEAPPAEAGAVITAYFEALNAGDPAAVQTLTGYPFGSLDAGELTVWQNAEEHEPDLEAALNAGWASSRLDSARAITSTETSVPYAVVATCPDADDEELSTHEGLYVVAKSADTWSLKLVSSVTPLCE